VHGNCECNEQDVAGGGQSVVHQLVCKLGDDKTPLAKKVASYEMLRSIGQRQGVTSCEGSNDPSDWAKGAQFFSLTISWIFYYSFRLGVWHQMISS
jgi:hypothetical protein